MKIGIFGGTFDPIHTAHLILAETAREECQLEEVWFLPAAVSPHKQEQQGITPAKQRLEMVRLAIAGHAQFRASDLELKRPAPSYTVDTLQILSETHPDHELHLLIGADSLNDFLTWKDPERILQLAQVVALNRGELPADDHAIFPQLNDSLRSRLRIVSMPAVDLSATRIREQVCNGKSVRYQLPRAVELYVQQAGLYRS